jgi:hypothetical protein
MKSKVIRCSLLALLILITTTSYAQQPVKLSAPEFKGHIASGTYPKIDGVVVVSKGNKILVEEYFNGYKRDSLHCLYR